jgi:hypothetical protein
MSHPLRGQVQSPEGLVFRQPWIWVSRRGCRITHVVLVWGLEQSELEPKPQRKSPEPEHWLRVVEGVDERWDEEQPQLEVEPIAMESPLALTTLARERKTARAVARWKSMVILRG